jgi:hypothetical protein
MADQRLVTVDPHTGTELQAVPLPRTGCCPRLILAASG